MKERNRLESRSMKGKGKFTYNIILSGLPRMLPMFPSAKSKNTFYNTHCTKCDKEIPPGRKGRKCKECRK